MSTTIISVLLGLLFIMNATMMYLIFKLKESYVETKNAEKLFRNVVEVNNRFIKENTDAVKKIFEREETMIKLVDATMECYEVFKKQNKTITDAFHVASKNYDEIMQQWKSVEEHYSATYEQYNDIKKRVDDISARLPITITPYPTVEPGLIRYEVTCDAKGDEAVNG